MTGFVAKSEPFGRFGVVMCRTLHTPLATGLTEVIFVKALVTTSLFYIGKIYRLVDNLSLQIKLVAIVASLEVLWQFGPFKMWHICEQQQKILKKIQRLLEITE